MDHRPLFLGVLFCSTLIADSYSHVIFEEKKNTDVISVNNNRMKLPDLPPISIVERAYEANQDILEGLRDEEAVDIFAKMEKWQERTNMLMENLTKTSLKLSRKEAEKNKSMKRKAKQKKPRRARPSPPPNCVATWGSCELPSRPCCDFCAFCHCRLFQTVCYCRMGNPNC